MTEVFKFLLDAVDLEGTVVEKRIIEKFSAKNAPKSVYKLKSTDTNLSRNESMYTTEQLEKFKKQLKDHLYFFGYTNHPDEVNKTAFFEFEKHEKADLANFKKFQTMNEIIIADLNKTKDTIPNFYFNNGGFASKSFPP